MDSAAGQRHLSIITLITDFGLSGYYVGAMKGAVLSVNPAARVIDITHEISPRQVEQAAFVAAAAWPYFPPGCVHVAVVDPGVGTERRALALQTPHGWFVGPDNGVLSAAIPDDARRDGAVAVPEGCHAVVIEKQRFMRRPVSATFHGRDVFGPVAAHLTLGVGIDELGNPVSEMVSLPPFRAVRLPDGSLRGRVVYVDHFGNLITDVRRDDLAEGEYVVTMGGREIVGPARTYGEGSGLIALIGSAGFLEIAVGGGSAAQELDVAAGAILTVRRR